MELRKGKPTHSPLHYLYQTCKLILVGILFFACIDAINHIRLSRSFPIKSVSVYGLNHTDQQEVQSLLQPLVSHGFFGINVEFIRDRLLQMPWVADILVRRSWPDHIEVTVVERTAVAKWNDQSLLSTSGEVFSPKPDTYPANLPTLIGPQGKQVIMLDNFNEINRILIPLHAKISYLELTPFLTWKVKLDNGINLQIGHKDVLTRLNHFVKVYPKIIGTRVADVDYIDLRYPNGVAVRWKTPVKT